MKREVFFYELSVYMLNKVSDINQANKETKKIWISFVQQYVHSKYLDASYKKWYPDSSEMDGIHYNLVWEDLRKTNIQNSISIQSNVREVLLNINEDLEEKAIIYLMNEFAREHPNKLKI